MTPDFHIPDEQLDEYAVGTLSQELVPTIEEHLLVCADCQLRLQSADEFTTLFRAAAAQPAVPAKLAWRPFRRAFIPVWATAAAAACVLIVSRVDSPRAIPATVFLQSTRGPETSARIKPGAPALLVFDLPSVHDAASYEVEVVDDAGRPVLNPVAQVKDGRLSVLAPKMGPGSYWVRVYRNDGHRLIVEYALQAK